GCTGGGMREELVHRVKMAQPARTVAGAIAQGSLEIAYELEAKAILCSTTSGQTARLISKNRPLAPIIGATSSPETYRQLALSWGVVSVMVPATRDTDTRLADAVCVARDRKLVAPGDTVLIIGGVP